MRLLAASAASTALLALTGGAGAQSPTLVGTVGPGFAIALADASGNPVSHLDPGTYTIQVSDRSALHNFHLSGPGVDLATGIEATGTATWTVTLAAGTYRFQCDAHPTTMTGKLTVGTPAAATTLRPRLRRGRRSRSRRSSVPAAGSRSPGWASASARYGQARS
jgi:type 1 fimbria pilin